ncbi:hypothetical protein QT381_15260 [Galbitalea sp. SE-J8]|nr:hypothetical protein [Galbitalea sp. SE-J8]MDM4764359.1 hypothetical protein [Galbitalea sp. SE-J8]
MAVLVIVVLLANAVFNAVAWPQFLRRVSRDPRARDESGRPTPFLVVHRVLVGIALSLAVISAGVAVFVLTVVVGLARL